jgi:L-rhamnose-H+ transport protein
MSIILGSLLCALGGAGVGSFLLPLKFSKTWKWENSWLVGAFFMYVLFPLIALRLLVPEFGRIYAETPLRDILMIYFWGVLQGSGSFIFTYGTTLMGLALGYALMIGAISVVSLLVPLMAHLDRVTKLDGITLLIGLALLLIGIALAGRAGWEREIQTASEGQEERKRVNLGLAVFVVIWAGIANSLFYFTFEFQKAMKGIAIEQYGVPEPFWGFLNTLPFFLGMFTMNLILTGGKMIKEGTLRNYWAASGLSREYALGFAIGLLWYLGQGVAYTAGHTLLGPLGVAIGAALFMGTMMVVSNISGLRTGEWKGVRPQTVRLLYAALAVLVVAMSVVAVGNYLQQEWLKAA